MSLMKRILLLVLVVAFCIPLFAMQTPPKKAENKQKKGSSYFTKRC